MERRLAVWKGRSSVAAGMEGRGGGGRRGAVARPRAHGREATSRGGEEEGSGGSGKEEVRASASDAARTYGVGDARKAATARPGSTLPRASMLGSVRPRVPSARPRSSEMFKGSIVLTFVRLIVQGSSRNGAAANSNLPLAQPRLGSWPAAAEQAANALDRGVQSMERFPPPRRPVEVLSGDLSKEIVEKARYWFVSGLEFTTFGAKEELPLVIEAWV
uniref:Transposon protein, putative, unclassified n=1 Tax=Oryza sativa subsp. japonica TaxID=39947 RepID=Q94H85_ORYSJ|nr:transposon protein, putative, unclassified [Oryza sativa Japonica Group]